MYKPKRLIETDEYFPKVSRYVEPILEEWIDKHKLKEDIKLHHYTTPEGLKGIIKNREIWSTDIESMNDTKEIKYGLDVISEEIKTYKDNYENNDLVEGVFLSSIEDELESMVRERYNIFVTCFCNEEDLLSQWRGYADRGGGYSIEFKFNQDTKIVDENENINKPNLRRVIYDKDEQREITGTLLGAVCSICDAFPSLERENPNKEEIWKSVAKYVSKTLVDFAISFKHDGFREEKEWRLVRVMGRDEVNENVANFRVSGGLIVPYVTTRLVEFIDNSEDIFPIIRSVWGPSHNDERARRSLNLFIESVSKKYPVIDFDEFEIESPEVPFKPPSV